MHDDFDDYESFRESFLVALESGLQCEPFDELAGMVGAGVKERLARFAFRLNEANRTANLTRITEPGEMATKHVLDSMSAFLAGSWPEGARVCDVGTGGGLPGMVLVLVRPDLRLSLVDAVAKKLAAVETIAASLGLACEFIHARAEDLGRESGRRESFDTVVARAVAPLPALVELCLPLVRVEGHFVAMKGRDEELDEGAYAIRTLGGAVEQVVSLELPDGHGERTLICIRKVRKSPAAYPRRPGLPAKRPLVRG